MENAIFCKREDSQKKRPNGNNTDSCKKADFRKKRLDDVRKSPIDFQVVKYFVSPWHVACVILIERPILEVEKGQPWSSAQSHRNGISQKL